MKDLKHSIQNLLNNTVEHSTLPRISTFTVLQSLALHIAGQRPLEDSPAVVLWKHVTLQTIWVTARVFALLTDKEFFSSACELVILEMTSTIARIVALLTSEIPFSCTNGCASWGFEVLLHCEQPKGFARGWLSMCLLRFPAVVQAKLHCVQLKDISPECIWLWILRWQAVVQEKLHCVWTTGFFPLWSRPPLAPFLFRTSGNHTAKQDWFLWTSMCLFSLEALVVD